MSGDINDYKIKESMKRSICCIIQNIFSDLFAKPGNLIFINSQAAYSYKTASFSMSFSTTIPNSMRMRCCMLY